MMGEETPVPEGSYWKQRRVGRRELLRGAGITAAGLAGATLLGCGGDDSGEGDVSRETVAEQSGGATLDQEDVRVPPGAYEGSIEPTAAEQDPLRHGRRGGTLLTTYLDPPHMDFNRTLSCTINSSMDYTKNKLTRARFGPSADPDIVEIEPDLAESWEMSDDSTQFTFHLHQGVRFHNVEPTMGREFTSEDVRLSIERYQAGGVQKDVWSPVTSIETPDNYTVVLTLDQPLANLPQNIAAWSHMDAKEMLEDLEFLGEHAVGTGPFVQEEWTPKERSVFVRHPEYFEEGLPFLDRAITVVQNDLAVLRAGFLTNDFMHWTPRDEDDALMMMEQIDDAVYLRRDSTVGANTSGLHFQMENPKFQDERVRRAASLGVDRVGWAQARYNGEGGGYSATPIPWPYLFETLPTLESQGPWYQFNPGEARALLQAAGYSEDNPLELDLPVWYQREFYSAHLVPIYDQNVPEIRGNFRQVDNPTAVTMLNARDFDDTMNITWGPPVYSVDQAVYPWYHSQGGLNHNNVNDAEMDRLVVAQRQEQDPEGKLELWRQIEARYLDQVWDIFWPTAAIQRTVWHNYLANFRPHGIANDFSCYGDGKARSVWLAEGAPTT